MIASAYIYGSTLKAVGMRRSAEVVCPAANQMLGGYRTKVKAYAST